MFCRPQHKETAIGAKKNQNWKAYLVIVLSFVVSACSTKPLKPIEENLRQTITIVPITDLTANYTSLPVPFDSAAMTALSSDFVEVIEPIGTGPELRVYANPFRFIKSSLASKPSFTVRGEVERIAYEPASQIKKMVMTYALSGLLVSGSDQDMGAFMQYRFYIYDAINAPIDSFVVVGASTGDRDKVSRRMLMAEANRVAACNFVSDLLLHLKRKYDWNLPNRLENPPIRRKLCTKDLIR